MSNPATRATDVAICPLHGDLKVLLGSPTVQTNAHAQARAGDFCLCTGGVVSHVSKGSSTVRVNSLPTAHAGDTFAHRAVMIKASPNVVIGGPDVSVSGPVASGKDACKAAAATRHVPGSPSQTYGNCALETDRQLINAYRASQGLPPLTEDEMLALGLANGANQSSDPNHRGGMNNQTEMKTMASQGIPMSEVQGASEEDIARATEAGYPVAVTVHAGDLWGNPHKNDCHEILVTGVERDANGNIIGFYFNDTGAGVCGAFVSVATMAKARQWTPGRPYPILVPQQKCFQ